MSVVPSRPMPRLPLVLAAMLATPAMAQDTIYRCGNEYTNNAAVANPELAAAVQQLRQAGAGEPDAVPKLVRALGPIAERETVPALSRRATIEQVVRVALLDGLG